MSLKQTREMETTLHECLRSLSTALGDKDFHVKGDQVVVDDGSKKLVINLVYEGDRKLGSLNLPMTQVNYEFSGYTEDEMNDFMAHLSEHLMRAGGG